MTNPSSSKRSSSNNRHASTSKDPKNPKKRGRKVAPSIIRPTLPTYGMDKVKTGYVSDTEDPTRSKSGYTTPAEGGLINVE
ncbi:hypothetical protein EJD97_008338 [Solanum chilense]|uniref:Uncharacterized protein n=1 Tax=Solanum chilense TaxID=4083 RepID=A0A6N2AP45_SOLCI|nr:hypothetical protein EJD97_008338 [Solanum chilense]